MKYFYVLLVIGIIVVSYILIAAEQPAINQIVETANASANWTGFEDAQNTMNAFPIYMWAIPGFCGIILVVYFLKFWKGDGGDGE